MGWVVPLAAQTIWEGDTDSAFFNAANWSSGTPTLLVEGEIDGTGTNSPELGTLNGGFQNLPSFLLTQTGDTVSVLGTDDATNGAVSIGGSTVWNLNGGFLDVSSNYELRANGTLIVDGGTLQATGTAQLVIRSNSADLQILSGSHDLTGNRFGAINGSLLIDGASLTAAGMNFGNFGSNNQNGTVTLQNGASLTLEDNNNGALRNSVQASATNSSGQLNFGPGVSSLTAGGWTFNNGGPDLGIDFDPGAVGSTFTILNSSAFDETEWEAYWTTGSLTVGGANVGNFSDFFEVSGGTLTMVPEPGSVALLGIGAAALAIAFWWRRRTARV